MSDNSTPETSTGPIEDPEAATTTATEGDITETTPEQSDSDADSAEDSHDDDTGLSRRDVRYREKLRAAEAERDTLRATVETMQRQEVERLAAEHLVKPGSLWTVGVELDSLLDDDGGVDPEKVSAAAVDASQQHGLEDPQAARKRQPVVPREGRGNTQGRTNTWANAFK